MASKKKLKEKIATLQYDLEWFQEELGKSRYENAQLKKQVQQVVLTEIDGTPGKTVLYYFDPETGQQYPIRVNH